MSEASRGDASLRRTPSLAARPLIVAVVGYRRFISPLLPPVCRFAPSCSEYALEALRTHGAVRGLWLAARRLAAWCRSCASGDWSLFGRRLARDATLVRLR